MAQINRPVKQGGATTYGGKVSAGYTTILASEMDADLDTIYSAWNTGVDGTNIQPGSITGDKLAPGAVGSRELADSGVATVDLADGSVTQAKLSGPITPSSAAGGDLAGSSYPNPIVAPGVINNAKISDVAWGKITGAPTSLPPSGAAGGSLASSYPNPSIAGGAVGINELAVRATTRQWQALNIPAGWTTSAYNAWAKVGDTPTFTTRGGLILIMGMLGCYFRVTGGADCYYGIGRNGTVVLQWRYGMQSVSGGPAYPALPVSFVDAPGAGTYYYSFFVNQTSTQVLFYTQPDSQGQIIFVELG